MGEQIFQCCFCGGDVISGGFDVTSIIVITNWDKESEFQQEQQLFCHMECLKERLSKDVSLYVADIED